MDCLPTPGAARRRTAEGLLTLTVLGSLEDVAGIVHPGAVNRESVHEPPAARVPGPAGFAATGAWLRAAFTDIRFPVDEALSDGDLLVTHGTMSGRHTGPFVLYGVGGSVERVFTPTGRTFTVTHTHWLRVVDGLIVEHWANRDDQGQALQLGWTPPSPLYLVRCARATRAARLQQEHTAIGCRHVTNAAPGYREPFSR